MVEAARLLGLAFAGADLCFEIDRDGRILFAVGATNGFASEPDLEGRNAAELFVESERSRFRIIARGMTAGDRIGPLPMTLAVGGKANLSMCRLPQNNEGISCTLVRPGERKSLPKGGIDEQSGLSDCEAFLAAAAKSAGTDGGMALVALPDLSEVCAKMSDADSCALISHIGKCVKALGATAAGRLSQTSFGVVTDDPAAAGNLVANIVGAVRDRGIDQLKVEEVLISLKSRGLTPEQNMLALRHVVGRFAENKLGKPAPADLGNAFTAIVNETLQRAQAFTATVSDGAFDLVFEPIVDLKTKATSHYEALTRFASGQSPADTILFAEELGMADTFDLAVAVKVFNLLEDNPKAAHVAMNVSGRSITNPNAFAMLAGLLARKRALAGRLLIEVTESAEMTDLAAADRAIQAMREMGYRVGIDDFGSGAASLQYLQGLAVDFVKVDGGLIKRLGQSQREDSFLAGVVSTCAALEIATVAEWIDNEDKLQRCYDLGFRLGQGRYFGGGLKALPDVAVHVAGHAAR